MILNEDEVVYGFVNEENILTDFAIFKKDDFETIQRVKNEFNAHAAYPMDVTRELTTIGEAYWNGKRFLWPSPYDSWIFNEEKNDWEAPIPYPSDGQRYNWDENTLSWVLLYIPN